ncbi:iron chaperone [Leifsonia poae]|uniref:iron chaperone n=1 Tax=Leifsonia poae TaxID=110933 RepID=UPI001CBD9BDD|nr:DUF1801 domain-containing protein [Leifsonia poae]
MTNTQDAERFTDEERAAMKERAKELKSRRTKKLSPAEAEGEVLEKIAALSDEDRAVAERVHAIVRATAPELTPKLWYGFPAYAKNGKLVCYVQYSQKFKARYSMLSFTDAANLDDGGMWPTSYAVTELTDEVEARIAALVKQAAS